MFKAATLLEIVKRSALAGLSIAFLSAAAAPDAHARCRHYDGPVAEPQQLKVGLRTAGGARVIVDRVILATDLGWFVADTPEWAEAQDEDRLDIGGAIGHAAGAGALFPRPLTAYVDRRRHVGQVFVAGSVLYVDLRGLGRDATRSAVLRKNLAILTRSPFRHQLVGMRFDIGYHSSGRGAGRGFEHGRPDGDAYLTPDGLLLTPLASTLPGALL